MIGVGDEVRLLDAPEHPWERRRGRVVEIVGDVAKVFHQHEFVDRLSEAPLDRLEVVLPPPRPPARMGILDGLTPWYAGPPYATPDQFLEYDAMARQS